MISTGAFQTEMDASSKQPTIAEKFAAVWEKKNAKAARAGGVSLMALSLAACGSSSSTTSTTTSDTTTTTTPASTAGKVFSLTSSNDTFTTNATEAKNTTTSGDDTFRAATAGDLASGDYIEGGDGADVMNATVAATASSPTLKPHMGGVETFNLTVEPSTTASSTLTVDFAEISGVSSIVFKDSVGAATSAASTAATTLKNIDAGTSITIDGGTATNLAPSLTVQVKDAATNTADSLTVNLSDALANVVTAANVETVVIDNSNTASTKSSTITSLAVDKATDLDINGSGTLTITGFAQNDVLTAIDINGSGKKTLTVDANSGTAASGKTAAVKTIDASDATGAVTLTLTAPNANSTVTLGSGADKLSVADAGVINTAIGTAGAITGGDGKDTIALGDGTANAAFTSTEVAQIQKATGFEVLDNGFTAASNQASHELVASAFTSIDEFVWSGASVGKAGAENSAATSGATDASAGVTVTGVSAAETFVFKADITGGAGDAGTATTGDDAANGAAGVSFTPKVDGGADVLNVTLASSATDATAKVKITGADAVAGGGAAGDSVVVAGKAGIDASSFEVVNLSVTGKSASTFSNASELDGGASTSGGSAGDAITLNTNGKLVITGNKHIDFDGGVGGTNVTVDASDFTGIMKVTTNDGNNVIKGGSGADNITGGSGVDTITGGAGKDTFNYAAGEAGTSGNESITDFALGFGGDTLNLAGTTLLTAATGTDVSSAITSGLGTDTLTATVSTKGLITLAGNATAKIDTVAELKAIFELLDTNNTVEVGAIEMSGNTYVLVDAASGGAGTADSVGDIIQLTGLTGSAGLVTADAADSILIA